MIYRHNKKFALFKTKCDAHHHILYSEKTEIIFKKFIMNKKNKQVIH